MDMTSNLESALAERTGGVDDRSRQPDWNELRARFGAAFAARRELGEGRAEAAMASFAPAAAQAVAINCEGLAGVNRVDLANGKSVEGNVSGIASHQHSGDRG
jgi:hypothetical protein